MKSRSYLLALVALCVLAAPAAFAQRPPADADSGTVGPIPGDDGAVTVTRTFTTAVLAAPDGSRIGKVKTATVATAGRSAQALRVQISSLTPGAEYALVIDNTLVGTATATATGGLRMRFSNPPGRNSAPLPEALQPVALARTVAIYEVSSQRLVASGQFSSDGAGPK